VRQLGLEFNLVYARVEDTTLDVKHAVLVFKEFLAVLKFISVMNSLVAPLGGVVTDERALLSTFDLELDV